MHHVISRIFAFAAVACLAAAPAMASGAPKRTAAKTSKVAVTQTCYGVFSNGVKVNAAAAVYMPDVGYSGASTPLIPVDKQTACDVHTFAWNQFLYLTQNGANGQPRFMAMAPWYNALTTGAKPGAYPGGPTDLRTSFLDQKQAGDDDHLVDVANQTVRYDIRFDVNMYDSIVMQNYFTAPLFNTACAPDPVTGGTCKNNTKIWMSPAGANEHPEPGSVEVKTAWRDFGAPGNCPGSQYYCQGRFGLVGFHYVNKTFSHGEWIWASFEHVGNDPDCKPGGDETIAQNSPLGTPWSFFNPTTAGSGVMSSKMCSITGTSPSGVWKNYKLVGSVWAAGGMGPNQDFRIQIFQTQVPGLPFVAPAGFVHLADTAMETWLQDGSTGYDPFKTNASQAGCFLCHNEPSAFGQGNRQANMSHFPGKLPLLKLQALQRSLIRADSTAVAPK